MTPVRRPCASCPWRVDQDASTIPNFRLDLAEGLAATCPSEVGELMPGQPMFACHQSRPGAEVVCAGWLAVEGWHHMGARLMAMTGEYPAEAFHPGAARDGWPELHERYGDVLDKLRETAPEGS